MVRSRPKRPRTPDLNQATAADNEHASTILYLYRILAKIANLEDTKEEEHEELKSLWFSGQCAQYQVLMKSTLRMRPEVEETIPAAPDCFRHMFFFPLRQSASNITRPPKNRKTAKAIARQDIDEDQRVVYNMGPSSPPIMGPTDQDSRPLTGNDPFLYTERHGHLFGSEINLEPRYPAVLEPPTMSMEAYHEPNQGDVSLYHRGSMTLLDTQWPMELNDIFHLNGGNTPYLDGDAEAVHVRRS
ncbi:hypothetical protein FE257_000672 [Aspergillus nanangensis]|uniref:Uncharacterized protein n=1 Tax=Aspergillus nanangensis TaxID=2582783 RepID=A0AAD4GQ54_ASPNN|nr:hypothetical protein FE257_000672 [Aspergillus nanangensis]